MKTVCMLLILFVAFSCSPPTLESKAKTLIEEELKNKMNDWKSYEFVEMTRVFEKYTDFRDTEKAKELSDKKFFIERNISSLEIDKKYLTNTSPKRYQKIIDSLSFYKQMKQDLENKYEIEEKNFTKEHIGYFTRFKFRGKNKFGGIVLNEYVFSFDKDFTKIVDMINSTPL